MHCPAISTKSVLECLVLAGSDGRYHAIASTSVNPKKARGCAGGILCKSTEAGIWHCYGLILYLQLHIYTPMSYYFICYIWKAVPSSRVPGNVLLMPPALV